jgi:integrase/recombinase XerD
MIDPDIVSRRCLNVEEWPEQDQALWRAATTQGDVFDDAGRASQWRQPTLERTRQGYGRWLSFLSSTGQFNRDIAAADRITRDAVRDYVLVLQQQVTSWTTWSYVLSLWIAARIMGPDTDWEWLYRIVAKLKLARSASTDKRARMVPAAKIAAWAFDRMEAINAGPLSDTQQALAYRNALMIAVLVHCPVRLRNLTMVRLNRHLSFDGIHYRLDFEPHEVKTDRFLTCHLPPDLTPPLQRWLTYWRPMLLKDTREDALWVGIRGTAMRPRGIYGCVIDTTATAFGVAINPHLFRDIAVSWLVDMDPAAAGITAPILGHINPKTTEEHYIQANQALAVDRYGQSVTSLRQQLAQEYGNPLKGRNPR